MASPASPGTITIATNMAGRGTDIKLPQQRCEGYRYRAKEAESRRSAIIGTERQASTRRMGPP